MARFPRDIFTEPEPDTLANLGPLTGLAGIGEGKKGSDDPPVANDTETDACVEPGQVDTFHDPVGCWPWEPAGP